MRKMSKRKPKFPEPDEVELGCGLYAHNDEGQVIRLRAVCEETGTIQAIYLDNILALSLLAFMKSAGWQFEEYPGAKELFLEAKARWRAEAASE